MNEREAIVATADRIAQRMGGRFVLNEDRPMTDKPEAVRYRKTATITATQWWKYGDHPAVMPNVTQGCAWIDTLEGGHIVTPGDWIATGVNGEHWPIKPDVFAKTYVPDTTPSQPDASALVEVAYRAGHRAGRGGGNALTEDEDWAGSNVRAALSAWEAQHG